MEANCWEPADHRRLSSGSSVGCMIRDPISPERASDWWSRRFRCGFKSRACSHFELLFSVPVRTPRPLACAQAGGLRLSHKERPSCQGFRPRRVGRAGSLPCPRTPRPSTSTCISRAWTPAPQLARQRSRCSGSSLGRPFSDLRRKAGCAGSTRASKGIRNIASRRRGSGHPSPRPRRGLYREGSPPPKVRTPRSAALCGVLGRAQDCAHGTMIRRAL